MKSGIWIELMLMEPKGYALYGVGFRQPVTCRVLATGSATMNCWRILERPCSGLKIPVPVTF